MKTLLTITLLALGLVAGSQAQPFALPWSSADGGGGASAGGPYALAGAVGQPDSGRLSGGGFQLTGGFWGILVVLEQPGVPTLTIARGPGNTLIIAWPAGSASWRLEQSPSLAPAAWSHTPQTPQQVGDQLQVVVPLDGAPPRQFFRLARP